MGKFSDPNYKLLKDYFDILVATRTGTDKSYLIGPNKTVVSDGGVYSILYEDHPTRGYIGHRFTIDEIDGNRFKMTYVGLDNENFQIQDLDTLTTSTELSAFGIGNNFYFRKDSFFHYWLARPNQDNAYHDYCNQEKTFLFFGKIWPRPGTNTYAIEFEGLKDFTLNGLPEHNQTVNMKEWLNVYWDQIHHQMYNMTKNFWSMFDAREIDIRWLAYIAQIYGIEISEAILNEISLREWVENLPYFLKRIGTYNALYIVWKVFMQNTQNHLNVYERWGEWCTQTLDQTFGDVIDTFVDHHFLEFYGTQPSGGAGDYYYSQYDPTNYPTHTLTQPDSCGTFKWDFGTNDNFLLTSYENLNCSIGDIREDSIEVTGYDPQRLSTQVMYLSGGNYSGDFTHSIGIEMNVATSGASNLVFWAMSNEVSQISDHTGDYICLSYEISGGARYFKFTENEGGVSTSVKTTYAYQAGKPYYLILTRTGTIFSVTIFDRERKWAEDLVETMSLVKSDVDIYSNLYILNAKRIPTHGRWYGKIYALYTTGLNYTRTVGASGNMVMTPHYKVQIDLSTEPLGDIFDDQTIISENVIKELYTNFEYVRPVSKYAHYEELIAPLARIDRTGDSIPLYSLQSNGFFNTFFTGSQYLSAGSTGGAIGVNTFSYFQQYASKTWTVTHDLGSDYLLVQPWVFTGISSDNAIMIIPENIRMIDENTVEITFNESYRGVVAIAGVTGDAGVSYTGTDYVSAANATWSYTHNMYSSPASGYPTDVGPVVMHWDNSGYRIFPMDNYMDTDDSLETTWDIASGGTLIRRSDYIHYQYDPANKWEVEHDLNSWIILQCYQLGGAENDYEIFPRSVKLLDENNIEIYWGTDENGDLRLPRGYVHIVAVPRDRVVYSPYGCDEFGIGMCANVLGYWKVGTGENTLWNPFNENDLETPVTSGTFYKIESDLNNIYIDFIVPETFEETDIKEVGLFNYLDDLILYSRSSGLYKPEDIQTYFHYRIVKLGSSSSSSVSSSSESSSSESSSSSSSSSSLSSSSSSLSSSSSSTSSSSTSFSLAFDSTFSLTTSDTDDTYWPFSGLNSGVYSYYTWLPSGGPDDSPCVEMSRYAYTSTFLSTKYIPASGFTHVNFDIDAKRNSTAIGSSYFPNIVVHQYDSGFGSLGVLTNPLYSGDFPSVNVWGDIIKSIAITNPSTAYIRAGFQSKLGAATGILLYLDNFNVSLSASSSSTSSSSSSTSVANVSGAGLNPLDKNTGVALSNNNTTATAQITPTAPGAVRSVTYHTSGKYYFEASFDVLATSLTYYCSVGVMDNDSPLDTFIGNYDIAGVGVGWTQREGYVYQDAIGTDTGVTCSAGDIAMCAVDLDTGEVWFGKNGTWVDSGDPALGTTPTATETELIGVSAYSAVQVSLAGTGEEITIYLGTSDMTYTIPNGFGAWG